MHRDCTARVLLQVADPPSIVRPQGDDASATLAAAMALSADAIVGSLTDGTITIWNESAHRIFGYTAVSGKPTAFFRC